MQWFIELLASRRNPSGSGNPATFDGEPVRASFYTCGRYLDTQHGLSRVHRDAFEQGHEIGNHSYDHPHGGEFSVEQWMSEIARCNQALERAGIPGDAIYGFRVPYSDVSTSVYEALCRSGFIYDASIEEGLQPLVTGLNCLWPYTLDHGSPGNDLMVRFGVRKSVGKHSGLWQIGNSVVFVPPDYLSERYGFERGLRDRSAAALKRNTAWGATWEKEPGKLIGYDHDVWFDAELEPNEVLATLKYTLDLRLAGNRAPFLYGTNFECYPSTKPANRNMLKEFVDYALSKDDVRIVPAIRVVEWMRKPRSLLPALSAT
jgi:peptidoglycan/xylan/chitin deacetylase (PgdA/CDA1 family)